MLLSGAVAFLVAETYGWAKKGYFTVKAGNDGKNDPYQNALVTIAFRASLLCLALSSILTLMLVKRPLLP